MAEFLKKYPAKSDMIGSFALQGMNGVHMMVAFFSSSSSIVLAVMIPGTEQPAPTMNGMSDFPLSPTL